MSSAEDILRIGALLDAYAASVDGKDWARLESLFTSDAVLDYTASGGPRASVADAIKWLGSVLATFPMTQHLITNKQIEINGDEATSVSSYLNPMQPADGPMFFTGGSYHTRYRHSGGTWLIAEHVQKLDWMKQLS